MTDPLEQCQRCRQRLPVDRRGTVVAHRHVTGWSYADGVRSLILAEYDCSKSGAPSIEEAARRKATTDTKRAAQLEAARPDAAVALDAFLSGRSDFAHRHDEFHRLAKFDYGRRFGNVAKFWRCEYQTAGGRRTRAGDKLDVYCVLCGEMLLRDQVKAPTKLEFVAAHHVTRCMLMFVAGIRDAVPRGTKVLPEEFRQEVA